MGAVRRAAGRGRGEGGACRRGAEGCCGCCGGERGPCGGREGAAAMEALAAPDSPTWRPAQSKLSDIGFANAVPDRNFLQASLSVRHYPRASAPAVPRSSPVPPPAAPHRGPQTAAPHCCCYCQRCHCYCCCHCQLGDGGSLRRGRRLCGGLCGAAPTRARAAAAPPARRGGTGGWAPAQRRPGAAPEQHEPAVQAFVYM